MFGLMALLGAIPALLVVAGGLSIMRGREPQQAAQRLLLYLAAIGALLTIVLLAIVLFVQVVGDSPVLLLAYLLMPALIGIWSLTLLRLGHALALARGEQVGVALSLALQSGVLLLLGGSPQLNLFLVYMPGVLLLMMAWGVGMHNCRWSLLLSALAFAATLIFYRSLLNAPPGPPNWGPLDNFGLAAALLYWGLLALLMVLPAVLITQLLRLPAAEAGESSALRPLLRWLLLGLAVLMPVLPLVVVYWSAIWDHTNDGVSGLVIAQSLSIVAIGAGMAMLLALAGKRLRVGLAFIFIVPWLPLQAGLLGIQTSHHAVTEQRAARIAGALEQYRGREGRYPATLDELAPRDLLWVGPPVLLPGEAWCYQVGTDAYRLEAFYREFFSGPVSLRLYQSAGDIVLEGRPWAERLAAVQERFDSPNLPPN